VPLTAIRIVLPPATAAQAALSAPAIAAFTRGITYSAIRVMDRLASAGSTQSRPA
jgi:hypothetical protein